MERVRYACATVRERRETHELCGDECDDAGRRRTTTRVRVGCLERGHGWERVRGVCVGVA